MLIYKITNKINGRIYIGQTTQPLNQRWKEHCKMTSHCYALNSAIKKYGREAFSIEVIQICENREDLNNTEKYYIDWHNCLAPNGYNLTTGGDSTKWSEETIKKRAASNRGKKRSEETRKKLSLARKKRVISEQTRLKTSLSVSGENNPMFGRKHSEESKRKISETKKGKIT